MITKNMDKSARALSALRATPLSLCLLGTALVIQDAHSLRAEMITEDEVITSLIFWIHPAAIIALVLGYALSVFTIFRGRSGSGEDPAAQHD